MTPLDDAGPWKPHVWKQRREIGGPWGWAFEVYHEDTEEIAASGWRRTEEEAVTDSARYAKEKNGEQPT